MAPRPRAIMRRPAARQVRKAPVRLMSMTAAQSSSLTFSAAALR